MAKLNCAVVPLNMVDLIWDEVTPHLQLACDRAPTDITVDILYRRIMEDGSMLMVVADGADIVAAITFEINEYETGHRVLYVATLGGACMEDWMPDAMQEAKNIAAHYNCDEIRAISARRGWGRILQKYGWGDLYTTMSLPITEK